MHAVMVMGLNGVGALDKSEVTCDFTKDSFEAATKYKLSAQITWANISSSSSPRW